MRNLLRYLGAGNREQDETGPKDITPADRVRLAHEKQEQNKSSSGVSAPADKYGPVSAKHGICEDCKRPLKLSLVYGMRYCPSCAPISNPKNVPFSRRLLMAPVWGAVITLGVCIFSYFAIPAYERDPGFTWLGFMALVWPVASFFSLLVSYPGDGGSGGGCGGCGG